MLRVRESAHAAGLSSRSRAGRGLGRNGRLAALAALGLALGAGGVIATVSFVQAEDDAGTRRFHLEEAARRRSAAPVPATSVGYNAYAPSRSGWTIPLLQTRPDGQIAHPPIGLNPFKRQPGQRNAKAGAARTDTAVAAADFTRSICVRLCDGFHAPLGRFESGDWQGHEALCQAMNPGIPVKVFRVAAGASTIDNAVARDGKAYRSLPMAYAYEKSGDPACRPAIVKADERRVSILRDFTLRPGDSVVVDGGVKTFGGASRYPYTARDFRDFRSSRELGSRARREIDARVGVSRNETMERSLRRKMAQREARLIEANRATDASFLRGSLPNGERGQIRQIPLTRDAAAAAPAIAD